MKTRNVLVILALLAASCTTKNENSALVIVSVIPPKAAAGTGTATGVTCTFDPTTVEFTELPYNPAENRGNIAAVVQNNLTPTTSLNPLLRSDSTTFLPHQAVVNYEYIPASAGAAPGQTVFPAGGAEVISGAKGSVGFNVFNGVNIAVPAGTYIRVTMHLEGKLLDGSLVHTSEREYLFRYCTTAGCGLGGTWAATSGTTTVSCL